MHAILSMLFVKQKETKEIIYFRNIHLTLNETIRFNDLRHKDKYYAIDYKYFDFKLQGL